MREIKYLVIHCSATKTNQKVTVADITLWHRQRGFNTIGYHYVIMQDGRIEAGRRLDLPGAHVEGHNSNSIGICYVGGLNNNTGKPEDTRTNAQKKSLVELLTVLKQTYPSAQILGHRDFPGVAKACPCFNAIPEYKNL